MTQLHSPNGLYSETVQIRNETDLKQKKPWYVSQPPVAELENKEKDF